MKEDTLNQNLGFNQDHEPAQTQIQARSEDHNMNQVHKNEET